MKSIIPEIRIETMPILFTSDDLNLIIKEVTLRKYVAVCWDIVCAVIWLFGNGATKGIFVDDFASNRMEVLNLFE